MHVRVLLGFRGVACLGLSDNCLVPVSRVSVPCSQFLDLWPVVESVRASRAASPTTRPLSPLSLVEGEGVDRVGERI
jgi:hypothetical protein